MKELSGSHRIRRHSKVTQRPGSYSCTQVSTNIHVTFNTPLLIDINEIKSDFTNGGKTIDFSGERQYPFPFSIVLHQRELILSAKTKEDRIMWVNAFMVLYEVKLIRTQVEGESFIK